MKTIDGKDISAYEAAKKLTFDHGDGANYMSVEALCDALNVNKLTDNQQTQLKAQLDKMNVRLRKICGMTDAAISA